MSISKSSFNELIYDLLNSMQANFKQKYFRKSFIITHYRHNNNKLRSSTQEMCFSDKYFSLGRLFRFVK